MTKFRSSLFSLMLSRAFAACCFEREVPIRRRLALGLALVVMLGLWNGPAQTEATPLLIGSAIRQLTTDPAIDVRPSWSPDGRAIAFQSNRGSATYHIYLMDADGGNQRALTQGSTDDRHPVWTPDGKSIVFDSGDGARREIWMVNVADGSRRQLTRLGRQANFAAPSPDGQRLAFYVYQNETLDLWSAGIDGSNAKPLTRNLASVKNNQCTFACHQAAWTQDSQQLAFAGGDRDTGVGGVNEAIMMVHRDGSNLREVLSDGADNHFPWFLPDGRLAFITEHVSPVQSWTDAWAFDLKSGQRSMLQEQMSLQGPFEFSPDMSKVLFHSPRAGNFDIYLIDLSAPDGVAALRGTPVPGEVAPGAPAVAPTLPPAAPPPTGSGASVLSLSEDDLSVVAFGTLGVLLAVVALGVIVFVRSGRR
ncbi:MAG: PD40 domain-containing protein [Chloroflexi bacterium]|nr:PD40 domain-containing protein [Chloroflexota bacterium]